MISWTGLTEVDVGVGVVTGTLVHQGLGPGQVLLTVPGGRLHSIASQSRHSPDRCLQLLHRALVLRGLHCHGDLHGLLVERGVVERLGVVDLVLLLLGVEQAELLVAVGRGDIVLGVELSEEIEVWETLTCM